MRRVVVAALVGVLAVVLAAPGASARPAPEDALGDATPKGDIVTGTYTANFTDIFLTGFKGRVTLRTGTDPATAAAWNSPQTRLVVQLDTTNTHAGPDVQVVAHKVEGVFTAEVTDLQSAVPGPLTCGATATFTAPNVYKVFVPADCLDVDITSVRARFRMFFDTPPAGGTVSVDKSPDTGWGSSLHATP